VLFGRCSFVWRDVPALYYDNTACGGGGNEGKCVLGDGWMAAESVYGNYGRGERPGHPPALAAKISRVTPKR